MTLLHRLQRSQRVSADIRTAWRFFSDPRNLSRITPPDLDFVITSPPEEGMYAGQIITYTIRPLFGIQRRWVTEITHVAPPLFFVDEQRLGPYRFWHHQHRFDEADGGVVMTDIVHYRIGVPLVEHLVDRFLVRPRLERIFDYRREKVEELLSVTKMPGVRGR